MSMAVGINMEFIRSQDKPFAAGVLSVECGTPEQAERSLQHLQSLLAAPAEVEHAARN
jgi:hypothetical protein